MNNFLTEEEELEIVLAISSEDARDLVADEAFARALVQTLDEVHEQREREQRTRNLVADEAFARALAQTLDEVHEQREREQIEREQREQTLLIKDLRREQCQTASEQSEHV